MWLHLRYGLFALVFLAVACRGPAAVAPPTPEPEVALPTDMSPNVRRDRRAETGVRAPAKALVLGKASSVKCGELAKAAPNGPTSELLSGRLLVRAPDGANVPDPLPDGPSLEEESRIIVEPASKERKDTIALAIVARETFQLDPDLYASEPDAPAPIALDEEAPKFLRAVYPNDPPLEVTPVAIGSGKATMRAYAARPRRPSAPPGKDTALVLALLVAQEDGALESIGFYVRGEAVRRATGTGLVGCTRLAERIAATLTPGPRKLERAGGTRELTAIPPVGELTMTVPDDYVVVRVARGARLYKLRPLSLYPGSISVLVVDDGDKEIPKSGGVTVRGELFGRPTTWRGETTSKGGFLFAAAPLDVADGPKTVEVLVKATRQATMLDEFRGVAETLSLVKD